MRRILFATGLASAALILSSATASAAVHEDGQYTFTSHDSGTCHPQGPNGEIPWAEDLGTRAFTTPAANPAGDYTIIEDFDNGHFSTHKGISVGACDNGTDNGHRVREGLQGTFSGEEKLFIHGGTYSPGDGSCTGTLDPCDTASYVAYHYGSGATITLISYVFRYNTSANALGKSYTDKGVHCDTTCVFTETGDIYTSVETPTAGTSGKPRARTF